MKARIATEWLSGCAGCHVAVVDLHEKLLNVGGRRRIRAFTGSDG
jgi:coenzyme F420-reducing hydrogenase gamma subunit